MSRPLPDAGLNEAQRLLGDARCPVPATKVPARCEPASPVLDGLCERGLAALRRGDLAEAVALLREAAAAEPDSPEVLCAFGNALRQAGQAGEAVAVLRRIVAAAPGLAATHIALGDALGATGRHGAALGCYGTAVRLAPENGHAHAALGKALLQLRRFAEAAESCARAVQFGHATPGAWSNLGAAQQALHRHEEAVASFRTAAGLLPHSAVLLSNLGNALVDAGDLDGARAACERAATLDPALAEAQINLGRALHHSGQRGAAIACHRQALALRPGSASAHVHLGTALLAAGQFREGWAHYEHRLRQPGALALWQSVQMSEAHPLWDGTPMPGRTLLVAAEQGNGDIIQFARFLPLARELCGCVVFRVPRRLAALLDGVAALSPDDTPLPPFDAWCPLMSLPHRLGTTLDTIPAAVPYLHADPARVERWRRALPAAVLRVGVAWQGNPAQADDRGRSAPLSCFAPLAAIPGVRLVSLQKGLGAEQAHDPHLAGLVHQLGAGFDAGPDPFLDAAAVMASLDLVITTDTAVAHLAGALGRPAWVLLRRHAEWRWLEEREDTPWYPSLRLFRQEQDGNWAGVVGRMAGELAALAAQRGPCLPTTPGRPSKTAPEAGIVMAPLAPGDLLDRIAILEVKAERIGNAAKQTNVLRELGLLREAREAAGLDWGGVAGLEQELRVLHARLWDAEDTFRGCEKREEFGPAFTAAARVVIAHNTRRAELKRAINLALGSCLLEEKAYGG